MLPQGQKKEELKYIELHAEYKSRLNSPKTSAKLLIPKHTTLMVWYERWQFNDDFMDYKHMWERGEPTFHIPEGIVRYDRILSNKDVEVVMVLMSKRNEGNIPDSRIIEELSGGSWPVNIDYGSPSYEYEPYGLWVKMYEHPTYIPELGTQIVAYGVMEENLPTVNECFKYGNKKHSRIDGKVVINPLTMKGWGNINSIATHGQERMRLDSNGNISLSWTCNICGMDTSQVEYDYLGSGTNHLECELKNGMSFMQHMEHMKRSIHLEL